MYKQEKKNDIDLAQDCMQPLLHHRVCDTNEYRIQLYMLNVIDMALILDKEYLHFSRKAYLTTALHI